MVVEYGRKKKKKRKKKENSEDANTDMYTEVCIYMYVHIIRVYAYIITIFGSTLWLSELIS